jgi:6-phosphogluconolactonase
MTETLVRVSPDPEVLAQAAAARFVVRLVDAQAERGLASVVLTGGRTAERIYRALRDSPARDAVDWRRVDVWWGDERFLPAGDPERNETQARAALLDALPLDPARVHPMPAAPAGSRERAPASPAIASNVAPDPETAAAHYADALAAAARPGTARLPHFDLLLLGVGEDGHVASVFPEHPAAYETRPVAGVRGSPKPPANRITLTLPALNTAQDVWLLATGPEKASAVGMALVGHAGPVQLPACGVRGVERTVWLVDRAAASEVPSAFFSLR